MAKINKNPNKARDRRDKILKAVGKYRAETNRPLLLIAETEKEIATIAQFLPERAVERLLKFNKLIYYCIIKKRFRAHEFYFGVIPCGLKLSTEVNKYLPLVVRKTLGSCGLVSLKKQLALVSLSK